MADPRPRPAGPRRRARRARGALDPDDDVRGGPGTHEGDGRLGGDRDRRRRGRPAARRDPRRVPLLAVDLLRQRPGRHRRVPRSRCDLRARVAGRAPSTGSSTSPARSTVTAGLIALVYGIVNVQKSGWTSASTIGFGVVARRSCSTAFVLIEQRSARAARAARHLPRPHAPRRERRDAARRVGPLRDVLLHTLYIQRVLDFSPLAGRSRVPAGDGRDRHRRRPLADRREAARHPHDLDHRHVDRDGRDAAPAHDATRTGRTSRTCCPASIPISIGMGLTFVPVTLLATSGVEHEDAGPRVGALQHLAAGRRRARARDPLHARGQPDGATRSAA